MVQAPFPTRRLPSWFWRARTLLYLALVCGALVTTTVLPFALAGFTGNGLWIAAPVVLTLVYVALREMPRCLAYYRSLWPGAWAPALLAALVAMAITLSIGQVLSLAPASSPLNWSLGSLFGVGGDAGMNGFAIPLTQPVFVVLYAPLAVLALPLLAWWEESIFRRGTRGMAAAVRRSMLFGLVHITAGVSLGACLALGCAGFIFTMVYWRALRDPHQSLHRAALPRWVTRRILRADRGRSALEEYAVFRATQAHLLYNAVGITAIMLLAFGPWHLQ
jgi:hypothetical protein